MRLTFLLCCLAFSASIFGQTATVTPDLKNASLSERYQLMKSTAQTFQDYKVVKEVVLDKEWRIMLDSIRAGHAREHQALAAGIKLKMELQTSQNTVKQKDASIAPTEYAASHFNFLGIDFNKAAFSGFVISIIAALVVLVLVILGRLKMVNNDVKEKTEAFDRVTQDLENYKHQALERQTKLSRELQNERNRLQEMRGSRV